MAPIEREEHHDVHDVVGIGFGPAEVVDVRPLVDGDRVVCFDVIGAEGEITRGRNLVVALRPTPALPDGIYSSARVWHESELLPRLAQLALERPERFVVAGSQHGAAETARHLRHRFPAAEICAISDVARVTDVLETDDDVVVALAPAGRGMTSLVRADAIVFATGYEAADPGRLLGAAAAYCRRDASGDLRIGRDDRVQTTEHVQGAIHVDRAAEPLRRVMRPSQTAAGARWRQPALRDVA